MVTRDPDSFSLSLLSSLAIGLVFGFLTKWLQDCCYNSRYLIKTWHYLNKKYGIFPLLCMWASKAFWKLPRILPIRLILCTVTQPNPVAGRGNRNAVIGLDQGALKLSRHKNHLGSLIKQIAGPHPKSFWFSRMGVVPKSVISNFPSWSWCCFPGPRQEDY